ncbi:MAG: FHIPEP family type III secretion protein [Tabrizicola sp.]|nr:FHIPEP family type III secretion protein [Tabrizicola sp.]
MTTLDEISPVVLAECLRGSMKRQLCHRIAGPERVLGLALLGPRLETEIRRGLAESQRTDHDAALDGLAVSPEVNERLLASIRRLANPTVTNGRQVAVVVAADLRRRLRNHLAGNNIQLPVLAPHEIAHEVPTFPIDLIEQGGRQPNQQPAAVPARQEVGVLSAAR